MTNKNPKVSVIMPIFNVESFVREAVESILNQTFKDFEFIIINDGSTDKSLNIVKEYEEKDKRIVFINNEKNLGIIRSLNLGLKIARGKYIARMDGDDVSDFERIEIQYNFLEKNEDIFLLGTGAKNIDEKGKTISVFNPIVSGKKIKERLLKRNCFCHPSIMFRNKGSVFYREKMHYTEDYDLYLRLLLENKKLKNLPFRLLKYRIRKESISKNNSGKQALFAEKVRNFYEQSLFLGRDEYDNFDPKEILKMDTTLINDKNFLEAEIKSNFKIDNFKNSRKLCKRYFKNYGSLNIFGIYYLTSFLPKNIIVLIRKIFFIFIPIIYINIINPFYKIK